MISRSKKSTRLKENTDSGWRYEVRGGGKYEMEEIQAIFIDILAKPYNHA